MSQKRTNLKVASVTGEKNRLLLNKVQDQYALYRMQTIRFAVGGALVVIVLFTVAMLVVFHFLPAKVNWYVIAALISAFTGILLRLYFKILNLYNNDRVTRLTLFLSDELRARGIRFTLPQLGAFMTQLRITMDTYIPASRLPVINRLKKKRG